MLNGINIRQGIIDARTACGNRVRGLLAEYGEVVSLGVHKLIAQLTILLSDEPDKKSPLTPLLKQLLVSELEQLKAYNKRVKECDVLLNNTCQQNDICQRLSEMPGIGVINATILYVKLGTGLAFKNGRHFAAYLGLTPKQHSSGGKEVLLGN